METALIGFLGIIVGVLLREYFRVSNRIETYAGQIFLRRLQVYEEFYKKLNQALKSASSLIEDESISNDERHEIWSEVVLDIAGFTDSNKLLLNEDIVAHSLTALVGVEDIPDIKDDKKRQAEVRQLYERINNSAVMIRRETGLHELDKHFKSFTRSQPSSEIIDYVNKLRSRKNAKSKKKR